jgi:hypothetical protein
VPRRAVARDGNTGAGARDRLVTVDVDADFKEIRHIVRVTAAAAAAEDTASCIAASHYAAEQGPSSQRRDAGDAAGATTEHANGVSVARGLATKYRRRHCRAAAAKAVERAVIPLQMRAYVC